MANVTLSGVYKAFGEAVISKNINLEIDDGEFVVFVGPSGCLTALTIFPILYNTSAYWRIAS